jgi:hypothetical protein
MRFFVPLFLVLAACGGGGSALAPGHTQEKVEMIAVPQPVTRAVLSGGLCTTGDSCTCRKLDAPEDAGVGYPEAAGTKRFEVHVGPSDHALWVLLDDMVLYKSDEHSEDCFYVDLQTGQHRMILRASNDGGLSAAFDVHELGTQTKSWYDTFKFNCGSPGTCSTDELDEFKASLEQYKRNLMDPCGSTKVKQIAWDAGRSPDQLHPRDLQVELTLQVYEFDPDKPHGDPECRDRIAE